MKTNDMLSANILDILFENRNKTYGAYELRRNYHKRMNRALMITGCITVLAVGGSFLTRSLEPEQENRSLKIRVIDIVNIKPIEEKKKPVAQKKPPAVASKALTTIVIKKDKDVVKAPPTQEDLINAKIDIVDREGVIANNVVIPVEAEKGPEVTVGKKSDDEIKIFRSVEIEASFPGGDAKWRQYLERKLDATVPVDNEAPEGTYTTIIQFVVDKEGNISNVIPVTHHGYGMEEEAIRVIKKGPKWNAAIQNGIAVTAYRKQPITFQVNEE